MRNLMGQALRVVELAADGFGVKETAEELRISIETVKTHRKRALDFLNANNMAHAVGIAARRGYLPGVRAVEAA